MVAASHTSVVGRNPHAAFELVLQKIEVLLRKARARLPFLPDSAPVPTARSVCELPFYEDAKLTGGHGGHLV